MDPGSVHMHKKSLEAWFPGTWPRSKGAASSGEAAGPVHATPAGKGSPRTAPEVQSPVHGFLSPG